MSARSVEEWVDRFLRENRATVLGVVEAAAVDILAREPESYRARDALRLLAALRSSKYSEVRHYGIEGIVEQGWEPHEVSIAEGEFHLDYLTIKIQAPNGRRAIIEVHLTAKEAEMPKAEFAEWRKLVDEARESIEREVYKRRIELLEARVRELEEELARCQEELAKYKPYEEEEEDEDDPDY